MFHFFEQQHSDIFRPQESVHYQQLQVKLHLIVLYTMYYSMVYTKYMIYNLPHSGNIIIIKT